MLIASSEDAIRGLLMHLLDLPPDKINEIEIPNGLPLVYSFDKKCIQLLDDGKEREDPLGLWREYNFGISPDLLFRPAGLVQVVGKGQEGGAGDQGATGDGSFHYRTLTGQIVRHDPVLRLPSRGAKESVIPPPSVTPGAGLEAVK